MLSCCAFFVIFAPMNHESKYSVEPYSAHDASLWDDFVNRSRNATFLLRRGYMDYHADRFTDRSLMIYRVSANGRRQLCALFAACDGGDGQVSAHAGLTYGGLVLPHSALGGQSVLTIMKMICEYYHTQGYRRFTYKSIPHIYHRYPAEEDIYALFRCGARLVECNLSSAIDLGNSIGFNTNSRRNMRKAIEAGISVDDKAELDEFWPILESLLHERYHTIPVHSLSEIMLLASRFPNNINLIAARNPEGKIIAGTVIYNTDTCIHTQYTAASSEGKASGALPLIIDHILTTQCDGKRYLDFGTSNERHGLYLNEGLLMQKNDLGGRGVTYNIYEIDL